jgi:hypothetical protein
VLVLARKPGALRNGAPFKNWILPSGLERIRRKLTGPADGDRQMVAILAAVLSDGLPAVEAACLEALHEGVHSADVVLNILVPLHSDFDSLDAGSRSPSRPPSLGAIDSRNSRSTGQNHCAEVLAGCCRYAAFVPCSSVFSCGCQPPPAASCTLAAASVRCCVAPGYQPPASCELLRSVSDCGCPPRAY